VALDAIADKQRRGDLSDRAAWKAKSNATHEQATGDQSSHAVLVSSVQDMSPGHATQKQSRSDDMDMF
jgi:hypothetical protein